VQAASLLIAVAFAGWRVNQIKHILNHEEFDDVPTFSFYSSALIISIISFTNPAPVVSVTSIEASGEKVVMTDRPIQKDASCNALRREQCCFIKARLRYCVTVL
jgi:hypothetical protein